MVRLRKLVQAIAAASALTSGMAHALGLGDIHLRSALNQPLDAEIDLVEVRDLSAAEVIPKLASPEDFNKAGVDRQYFLTGLKFTPIVKPNGKSVIRVTSDRPVQEPYLNFLVEVMWPNGRLLREYTVLLDPPLYSPQTAAAVPRAPMAVPAPVARPSATAAPRPVAAPAPARSAAPAAAAPSSRRIDGNEYRTGKNDTLWEIAARARPDGSVSVQQTMLAIQDLNPDAFLGGNINRLKSGQVLRLPDAEQIKARTQPTAETEVKQQYTAWREGRSLPAGGARQLDATPRANAGNAPAQAETKDSLRLLSGENGKAKGGDKGSKDGQAVADKLAVTKESLDSTRRENDELTGRMTDLQSQMDKLQKLIALKDAQLAKLQSELGSDKGAAANGAAVPVPGTDSAAQPVTPPAPAAEQPVAPAPAGDAGTPPAPAAEAQPQPAPAPVAPAPAAEAKKPEPAPAPVAAPAVQSETSFIDEVLANPIWLGAIAGSALLALLVLLMIISRRRAAKEQESLAAYAGDDEPHLDDDLTLAGSELDTLDVPQAAEVAAPAQAAPERVAAQTSDALGEADIYIAYGRFNQAAELLQGAIYDEPQRTDLRLKLMEVYAEIGDREGFARQENELREIGGAEPQVEQLKSRYPGMVVLAAVGGGLAAAAATSDDDLDGFSLDDFAIDSPSANSPAAAVEPAVQPHGDLDDAFDLALDDLELGDDKPAAPAAAQGDELSFGSFDLDDDLTLGGSPAAAPSTKVEDDFAFDLDLPEAPAAKVEAPSLVDDLSDFSLDLDKDLEKDGPSTLASAEDDFLLGLDDDTASLSGVSPEEFSLDIESKAPQADDLPDDFDLSLADDEQAPAKADDSFAAQLDEVSAELDRLSAQNDEPQAPVESLAEESFAASDLDLSGESADDEDDFDFLSGADEAATKLDLARAYIDMGDTEGARDILDEVLTEGNDNQQQEARELLGRIA